MLKSTLRPDALNVFLSSPHENSNQVFSEIFEPRCMLAHSWTTPKAALLLPSSLKFLSGSGARKVSQFSNATKQARTVVLHRDSIDFKAELRNRVGVLSQKYFSDLYTQQFRILKKLLLRRRNAENSRTSKELKKAFSFRLKFYNWEVFFSLIYAYF